MSLEAIKARTAARKAAGINQVYPQHKPLLVLKSPCKHEGSILESCKTCGNQEGRHVRACLHPNPGNEDRETCTRISLGGNVQGCDKCPDYEKAE